MRIDLLRTDEEKEQNGVWFEYRELGETARARIAHYQNPRFEEYLNRLQAKKLRAIRRNPLGPESKEARRKAMARFILLEWEGFQDANGKEITVSAEHAELLLGVRRIHEWVEECSMDDDAFGVVSEDVQEESEGN